MSDTAPSPVTPPVWSSDPLVIVALHLPDLRLSRPLAVLALEDYVLGNAGIFAQAGMPAMMLQEMTRVSGPATAESLAIMGVLGRLIRATYPALSLGIIMRAHDPAAALAVAHATGASFVRLKAFVGGVMSAEGPRDGLAIEARAYRHQIGRDDIAILADVHDRTSVPRSGESFETASLWAQQLGADGLVVTAADFAASLARIRTARAAGVKRPMLVGGAVTAENVEEALSCADGVIVSTSLMRPDAEALDPARWDAARCRQLMDRARAASRPIGDAS